MATREEIEIIEIGSLPEASSIDGLYTPGIDGNNNSVKVPINLLKGNKGDSPVIGANGNWFVGDIDLGVHAQGAPGEVSKADLENIDGIDYKTTDATFTNLITSFANEVNGQVNTSTGTATNAQIKSSPDFFPIEGSTTYLTNAAYPSVPILFYNAANVYISSVTNVREFTTPALARFFKYNQLLAFQGETFIYKKTGTVDNSALAVKLGIGDIEGSEEVSVDVDFPNVIPGTVETIDKGLDANNAATNTQTKHTSYIEIKPNTTYETNLVYTTACTMWFYDSQKRPSSYIGGSYNAPIRTFTTPVNGKFLRVNVLVSDVANSPFYIREVGSTFFTIPNLVISSEKVVDLSGNTGVETEVIPFNSGGTTFNTNATWGYANEAAITGKYITKVTVKGKAGSLITVGFSTSKGGAGAVTFSTTKAGVDGTVDIPINRKKQNGEYLFVSGNYYSTGTANPVGGVIQGASATITGNLCVGVTIRESGDVSGQYFALGDSITYGTSANYPYPMVLASRFNATLTNVAVHGTQVLGLINTQIPLVPEGFTGIITLLVGINDVSGGTALGDIDAVIAKNYSDLVKGASFAESYRYALETLMIKCPKATLVPIQLLNSSANATAVATFRDAITKICNSLYLPLISPHAKAGIKQSNWPTFMPDGLHPNDAGHEKIAKVLANDMFGFFVNK